MAHERHDTSSDTSIGKTEAEPQTSSSESQEKPAAPAQDFPKPEENKPARLKQLWQKAGLDPITLALMLKGSLPPTIAIAMYQADAVANHFTTLGYLVAIASILGFCIMPRGKFIQTMTLNVIATCLAAALNLLALYTVTQARQHTTPTGAPLVGYNASASTVCAIWLVVQIYILNALRVARPQLQFPAILYSIFVVVSMTYGTQFPTMASSLSFMERLLEAFLVGFALATAVSFLIFPVSSRKVVFKEINGYLQLVGGMLKTQTAYVASLEDVDPVALEKQRRRDLEGKRKKDIDGPEAHKGLETPAVIKHREMLAKLLELHTKLNGDITPAKREIAYGKLESHDLTELWKYLRAIFMPLVGLSSMINILERSSEQQGWSEEKDTQADEETRHNQLDSLHFIMKQLHAPFESMTGSLNEAIQHILLTLELTKPPKKKASDEECQSDNTRKPGQSGFAAAFKEKIDDFSTSRQRTLKEWCHENGIKLPDDFFETSFARPQGWTDPRSEHIRERHQRQLFFVLYSEYLLLRVGRSVLDLVLYVDKRKADGAFKRSKVIFPGSKTLYKWIRATVNKEDISEQDSYDADLGSGVNTSLYLGEGFNPRRDPEHLPPRNAWEKTGNKVRSIPRFFRSEESVHGLRVAAATMTIGIVCYIRQTQTFFLQNRLLWAMIMVAMSMTKTSGQAVFQFVLRVGGTAIAMIGSYVIWYIVDGHTAGVIVFLWLWIFLAFYLVLKIPKLAIVGILSLVTAVLIIGYELQVDKIGVAAATQNGQPAYPTYELAPFRLATVAGGIFVAFIWTVFPYPVSESSILRKDISASLYLLSAYYAIVHESIAIRVKNQGGDADTKGTHAYHLKKARESVFSKLLALLPALDTNSGFSKFQLRIGGRFPREEYDRLIACIRRLMLWTSLASYSSMTFSTSESGSELSQWSSDFRKLITSINATSNHITLLLSVISSSLSNAAPLPPYMEMPQPFGMARKLQEIDGDLLSVRHIAEPEYSAFAVTQVVSQCINSDVVRLVDHVKKLVGTMDFSLREGQHSDISLGETSTDSDGDKDKHA